MPSKLKRPLTGASRSISPPAVRRKAAKISVTSSETYTTNESTVRVFSWNVNGVGVFLQKPLSFGSQAESPLRRFLKRHHWPHFICLQEVKVSIKDEVTQRRLQHAANVGNQQSEPTYRVHFSLPRDKYNATGFGGRVHGVATLVRHDCEDSIKITRRPDWDLEGRVLIHELNSQLVLINGYWVNGTENPYRNPNSGVVEGTRHDHKLRFHQHMLSEALSLTRDGNYVVMVGDMNVARHQIDGHPSLRTSPVQHVRNRYDFNQKFFDDPEGLKAIDVFRQLHGDERKYTYYSRGCEWGKSCDRADLIIAANEIFESGAIRDTDICDNPEDRGHSDHVPLWVEVDIGRFSEHQHMKRKNRTQMEHKV